MVIKPIRVEDVALNACNMNAGPGDRGFLVGSVSGILATSSSTPVAKWCSAVNL